MLRTRRCVIKSCQYSHGTFDKEVIMFRVPRNIDLKNEWLENISKANNENYLGGGFVCSEHFLPEQIQMDQNKPYLLENAIPTEFWVECDSFVEDFNAIEKYKNEELHREMLKDRLDFEMREHKLNDIIKQQTTTKNELKRKLAKTKAMVDKLLNENKKLKDDLLKSQTSTDTADENMKQLIHCFLNGVKHNEKYPESVRSFCFNQHFLSVRAYQSLRAHFKNNLPHPGTIRSWYANCDMNLRPGINESCINILKRKLEEQRAIGSELVVSVLFDEMHIRKLFQWCDSTKQMLGYPSFGFPTETCSENMAANQVIVFMASGVNGSFHLPIAYHFIKSLDAKMRRDLVFDVVNVLIDAEIKVANIVFDGYPANRTMCEILGANFDIFSEHFKPYFEGKNGVPIMILLDVCHMEKLVRNALGSKLIFYDDLDEKIEWNKFVQLVDYKNQGFKHTHKLNKNHINWQRRKMKVNLAVELLSASTADSMELFMNEGHEEFKDATATIKFCRTFNDIFDCFNSKKNKPNLNVFKNPLCAENKEQIFETFKKAIEYIKGLKILNQKGEKILLVESKLKTGFVGYIISMNSLMMIFNEFVVKNKILISIPTYTEGTNA